MKCFQFTLNFKLNIYKLFTVVNYFHINYLNSCMSTIKIFIRRLNNSIYNIKSIIADILF